MNTKLLHTLCALMLTYYAVDSNAQANQTLSNLTAPTSVNQKLLPNTNNTKDLGSNVKGWRSIYFDSALYIKGTIALHITGTNNFFVGLNAGNTSNTGFNNTCVGLGTLFNLTSGFGNTANGSLSMYANTTGYSNTFLGMYSGRSNTSGFPGGRYH